MSAASVSFHLVSAAAPAVVVVVEKRRDPDLPESQ